MIPVQFRIHRAWGDVSGVVVPLLEKCSQGFVFQHPPDAKVKRIHIHGYMFEPSITKKTISQEWIKEKLNLTGNEDFSTRDECGSSGKEKIMDISGAFCYGSKWDTIAPIYSKNISPDLMEELRSYSRKMGTLNNIHGNSVNRTEIVVLKEVKDKVKPTLYKHCMTVVSRLNELYPKLMFDTQEIQLETVFETSYNYFRENELFMGKYKQLDFMDMVLMKWGNKHYKNVLFADYSKRYMTSGYKQNGNA